MVYGRGEPNRRGRPEQRVVDRGPSLLPRATSDEGFQGEFELPREAIAAFRQEEEFDQVVNQWDNPLRPDGSDLSKHAEFVALKDRMDPLPGLDGAYKRITSPGTGPHPEHDWLAYVDYELFQPGVKDAVDSTFMRGEPLMFRIGRKVVLPFLDAIVCSMRLDEAADFYLEPHAAFENLGSMNDLNINKRIKRSQPVLLRVYLVDFTNNPTVRKVSDWSKEEIKLADLDVIYQAALELKALGNDFFVNKKSLREAQNRYLMAITWLSVRDEEEGEDDEKKKRELMATLSMNVSKVFAESRKFKPSLKHAKAAIEHASRAGNPVQVAKANYRASFACRELKRFEEALPFAEEAIRLEPKDAVLRVYRKKLLQALKIAKGCEASMYKKMLGAVVGEGPGKSAPAGEPSKKSPAADERPEKSVHFGELPTRPVGGSSMDFTPFVGLSKTPTRDEIRQWKAAAARDCSQKSAPVEESGNKEQELKESHGPLPVALTVPIRLRQLIAKRFTRLVQLNRTHELYIPDVLPRAAAAMVFQMAEKLGLYRARNNRDETLFFRKQKPYTLPSGIDINVLAGL